MGLIKAQAAARVGFAGASLLRRRRGWASYPAALKRVPASASLHWVSSDDLIYLVPTSVVTNLLKLVTKLVTNKKKWRTLDCVDSR